MKQKNFEIKPEISLEEIQKFHGFLRGKLPDGVMMKDNPKISAQQAFNIIWYLQEKLRIFPDHFEMCDVCDGIDDDYETVFCISKLLKKNLQKS